MAAVKNIFEWLESVRERPSMYARSINELRYLVHGYYSALAMHGITESVPGMTHHFSVWIQERTHWPELSCGWGIAFDSNTPKGREPFEFFFEFVDDYRTLSPIVVAKISLSECHQPTGKRRKCGDGLMERPDEILAINYAPTNLNHLRHRYGQRYVDDWFLMLGNGSHETSLDDLIEWVEDEFNAARSEWEVMC